jgi:hypothetical protein
VTAVGADQFDIGVMVGDLGRLVEVESPSLDLGAVSASAEALAAKI